MAYLSPLDQRRQFIFSRKRIVKVRERTTFIFRIRPERIKVEGQCLGIKPFALSSQYLPRHLPCTLLRRFEIPGIVLGLI
jgi:hypothetical protein